jgi:hypothetical protein
MGLFKKLRMTSRAMFPVAVLCSAMALPAAAQTALGSIEGQVVDVDNAPVPGATVYPVSGPAGTGLDRRVLTNADGRFRLEQLVPGTYQVSAFKIEDGYANGADPFYAQADHPLPSITVTSATENADSSIQLGARCGVLHILVNDAVTGSPITSAALVLQQRNNRSASMQGQKSFPGDFLVPATDISVEIHAPGYNIWRFGDEGRDYLTVRPGEHHTLKVLLQPAPPAK